jgi:NAD(P)H-hydrate epimerase
MIITALSRANIRSLDEHAAAWGLPTIVLMENAGRGAACVLRKYVPIGSRIVVLCGPGNNGGDGAVLARYCDLWGYAVLVVWVGHSRKPDTASSAQRDILNHCGLPQQEFSAANVSAEVAKVLSSADCIVDGLFGTGLGRPVEGTVGMVIAAMNASGKPILSLDLPSGLDADSGLPLGAAVCATYTATFVARKKGFLTPGVERYTGKITVVDIGIPRLLLEICLKGELD